MPSGRSAPRSRLGHLDLPRSRGASAGRLHSGGFVGWCAARIIDWTADLRCRQHAQRRQWLAGWVPLKIVYLLIRRVLGLAVLVFRTDLAKDAELLVLRHENAVLRRHASRVRYPPAV